MTDQALRHERFLATTVTAEHLATIGVVLDRYPEHLIAVMHEMHVKIYVLGNGERYIDASKSLRRLRADVDAWPLPPAGLTVVEERTVYLRDVSCMTLGHELGHALDLALGGGVYLSGYDANIRRAFANAVSFITPYAATGLDEAFAEAQRAFIEMNNARSPWPKATRKRLKDVDPAMYAIMKGIFAPPEPPAQTRPSACDASVDQSRALGSSRSG